MSTNNGLPLVAPRVTPVLDLIPAGSPRDASVPAISSRRPHPDNPVRIALEQSDDRSFASKPTSCPSPTRRRRQTARISERFVKFLLWSRGGWRIYLDGPDRWRPGWPPIIARPQPAGSMRTSSAIACSIIRSRSCRHATCRRTSVTKPLGRHLEGCRIGFDLGGSDRKVAAVIDGEVVFSEETVWDPYYKPIRSITSTASWIR